MTKVTVRMKPISSGRQTLYLEVTNRGLGMMSPPGGSGSAFLSQNEKKLIEYSPTTAELKILLKEVESNVEAYESETKRQELIPFMYDRDLNWYFNARNIPAQQRLVMPTYDYFNEGEGAGQFEPLDFFNLLEKQYEDLLKEKERPFNVINNLKAIPLTERERHTLFGFLLKSFAGGSRVDNSDEQCNTVLKLVEKEFFKYPGHTPEKEFLTSDTTGDRTFDEVAAHLSAAMKDVKIITPSDRNSTNKKRFPESRYFDKVSVNFQNLPEYIIQKGIVWNFDNKTMRKNEEYEEWQSSLASFLDSVPFEHRIKALEKGIEYGKSVYKYHLDTECSNPQNCDLNQSWERRIALAENMLQKVQPKTDAQADGEAAPASEKNKEFTLSRQVLAMHYIFEFLQVRNVDATEKARFIQFITSKETGAKNIQNTNIYKKIKSPFSTDEKTLRDDLQFIRSYFEKLGLSEISKAITNEISSKE